MCVMPLLMCIPALDAETSFIQLTTFAVVRCIICLTLNRPVCVRCIIHAFHN